MLDLRPLPQPIASLLNPDEALPTRRQRSYPRESSYIDFARATWQALNLESGITKRGGRKEFGQIPLALFFPFPLGCGDNHHSCSPISRNCLRTIRCGFLDNLTELSL